MKPQTVGIARMNLIKPYRSLVTRLRPRLHRARRADFYLVREIRGRAAALTDCGSERLREFADDLKARIQTRGLPLLSREAVVESFALTTEALRRSTGKVYYDCQLLGGLVLATGAIAEMQTGEGKTVTCGLAAVLYGMTNKGVHVATTNAYLAQRDQAELEPVFKSLGLTSALNSNELDPVEKRNAYAQDVTYGTGYEFGFDFLRDQLALRNRRPLPLGTRFLSRLRGRDDQGLQLMQRPLHFAIIDEADSVLIDEAATPLILSGSSGSIAADPRTYQHARQIADQLKEALDYQIDWVKRTIKLTDQGWKQIHTQLPPQIQTLLHRPWSQYIEQALRANLMLTRDIDYVVSNDQVVIVDINTGRLHEERKWRSGLHQAIETKENVSLTEEREIEARITRQRYFAFYDKISGMTGTANGNEAELMEFYQLPVVNIDRNQTSQLKHLRSRYFGTANAKLDALTEDVIQRATRGQPVLVGTRTITQSRRIAEMLSAKNQPHVVLNGTQDEDEAAIIAQAGHAGAVTIATSMAGRGTDIKLTNDSRKSSGMHVIVAEHHDSPRVDRQLIGRSARQSDPGSCQFFVSAEDEIIQRYDPTLAKSIRNSARSTSGESRTNFDPSIRSLQNRIEKMKFAERKNLVIHDRWMETVQESVAKLA